MKELLNAHTHDTKHVFSFATLRNCRDPSGPIRSLIISPVPQPMSLYCITCTLCKKLYIGETGRRLGDQFREHLNDVEKDNKNTSKPVASHLNLPNYSKQHMAVCSLSQHQGSRETLEQKFIFQIGTVNPHSINERFSFNLFILLFFTLLGTNQ